mmetsp:Transcript_28081/g.86066  ORF Transcript_28081/g.86066 Transcript_28081/m.86066 type:complete len:440 (-) Transcript_28081:242-1561(-)
MLHGLRRGRHHSVAVAQRERRRQGQEVPVALHDAGIQTERRADTVPDENPGAHGHGAADAATVVLRAFRVPDRRAHRLLIGESAGLRRRHAGRPGSAHECPGPRLHLLGQNGRTGPARRALHVLVQHRLGRRAVLQPGRRRVAGDQVELHRRPRRHGRRGRRRLHLRPRRQRGPRGRRRARRARIRHLRHHRLALALRRRLPRPGHVLLHEHGLQVRPLPQHHLRALERTHRRRLGRHRQALPRGRPRNHPPHGQQQSGVARLADLDPGHPHRLRLAARALLHQRRLHPPLLRRLPRRVAPRTRRHRPRKRRRHLRLRVVHRPGLGRRQPRHRRNQDLARVLEPAPNILLHVGLQRQKRRRLLLQTRHRRRPRRVDPLRHHRQRPHRHRHLPGHLLPGLLTTMSLSCLSFVSFFPSSRRRWSALSCTVVLSVLEARQKD